MAKKSASRKSASKKTAGKKSAATKTASRGMARKAASSSRTIQRPPIGYQTTQGGIYAPANLVVVAPNKLKSGIAKAKKEIDHLIQEMVQEGTRDYVIEEIEFAASFNAEGKFLGVGVGGAATITFRIRPL